MPFLSFKNLQNTFFGLSDYDVFWSHIHDVKQIIHVCGTLLRPKENLLSETGTQSQVPIKCDEQRKEATKTGVDSKSQLPSSESNGSFSINTTNIFDTHRPLHQSLQSLVSRTNREKQ